MEVSVEASSSDVLSREKAEKFITQYYSLLIDGQKEREGLILLARSVIEKIIN